MTYQNTLQYVSKYVECLKVQLYYVPELHVGFYEPGYGFSKAYFSKSGMFQANYFLNHYR